MDQGFGILLGANIGTTFTALIASLPLNRSAQSVALAHTAFNVLGVLLILPALFFLPSWVGYFGNDPATQLAWSNILFNTITAIIALILLPQFEQLIHSLMKRLPQIRLHERVD